MEGKGCDAPNGKLLSYTQAQTTARYTHLMADPVREAAGKVAEGIAAVMR